MPILVEPDERRAAAVAQLLPDGANVARNVADLDAWLSERPDEYAVVLGPEFGMREAGNVADRLRLSHPSAGIVLIRKELSTDVFSTAMRAGIPAVVAEHDAGALRMSIERARQTWEAIHGPAVPTGNGGRVVTVFSPKGGVGKTTLAVNMALSLSQSAGSVCLVDLDLSFGDVAITLQVIPEHTIDEAIGAEAHLDFNMLQSLLTSHSDTLQILAAPTLPDAKDRIPPSLIRRVFAVLRRHFDYVVVDTSPSFEDHVLQAFDETDELVIVATLDVPTVKNVKMAIETLDLLGIAKRNRHLVLNRADAQVGLSAHDVEAILNTTIAASIPSDVAVATATNAGQPIVLGTPDHRVSRVISTLARQVAGAPPEQETATKRGRLGRRRHKEAIA